jgi:plasmid stability protein
MPTLYVENVPHDLYEALRKQAKKKRKSIAAEVIEILEERVPTEADLSRREQLYRRALRLSRMKSLTPGPFPSAEEMIREDRER